MNFLLSFEDIYIFFNFNYIFVLSVFSPALNVYSIHFSKNISNAGRINGGEVQRLNIYQSFVITSLSFDFNRELSVAVVLRFVQNTFFHPFLSFF